jgi:hypothetical protein
MLFIMKFTYQDVPLSSYCSKEPNSIMLLNAILKNDPKLVASTLKLVAFEEREKVLNSIFLQIKINRGADTVLVADTVPVQLYVLAAERDCDPTIISTLQAELTGVGSRKLEATKKLVANRLQDSADSSSGTLKVKKVTDLPNVPKSNFESDIELNGVPVEDAASLG